MVKNPSANAGDIKDTGLIPGLGRSPEEGLAAHSSVLAWRITWTRGAWWASPWGRKEPDTTERLYMAPN